MELPDTLRLAISDLAESYPQGALAAASEALSARYRAEGDTPIFDATPSPVAAAAYAATRLPATFAALAAVLAETRARLPTWRPTTLLDAGAGPGTAAWAAHALWPSLTRATLVERDPRMVALGQRLASDAPTGLRLDWRQADLAGAWGIARSFDRADGSADRSADGSADGSDPRADLCLCAYVLNELPHDQREKLVARLWAACGGALALVAPGTPAGFAAIRAARAWLIAAGAYVIAPCPHADACPMEAGDWCHFAQRLARSRLHRQLKGGAAPYEDEKFSYIVAARQPGAPLAARVIRHPTVRRGHITLTLCAPDGLERREVTHSDRQRWRQARDAQWGTALPVEEPPATPGAHP